MKTILLSLFLLAITFSYSQQSNEYGGFAYPTPDGDTLYLENEGLGLMAGQCWEFDKEKVDKRPVIVYQNIEYIKRRWANDETARYVNNRLTWH